MKSPAARSILGIVVSPSLELRGSCSARARASSRPVYFRILQSSPVPVDCPPAVVASEQDDPGSCGSFQKSTDCRRGPPTRFRLQRLLGPGCVESSGVESAALPISEEGLGEDPRVGRGPCGAGIWGPVPCSRQTAG